MIKWQYRVIPYQYFKDFTAVESTLDQFGAEGWEVISILQHGNHLQALMKRINEAAPGAPVNIVAPTLNKESVIVGADVMCEPGQWEGGTSQMTFQWQRDGLNITDGASAPTYRAKSGDRGKILTCACTATNELGWTTAISGVCHVS